MVLYQKKYFSFVEDVDVYIDKIYDFIEGNIDNIGKFDRMKHALTIFDSEDELIIKYAENE